MNKYKNLIFILLFILVSFLYKLQISIKYPPSSIHQWRQADALSITKNYFEEGMHFFEPKIHFQASLEGKAVGEFPIIYYMNAAIWKVTGENFVTVRLLNLSIVFLGLFFLFKLCDRYLNNLFYSLFIPLLIFSSPLFGYYSNNFLINLPAVCILFIGWYYLYKSIQENGQKSIIIASILLTVSVLLRPTMMIGIVPIYLIVFLEQIGVLKNNYLNKSKLNLFLLLLPFLFLIGWILFSKDYNLKNGSIYFLLTIKPIWDAQNKLEIWNSFTEIVLPEFYHLGFILLFFVMFLYIIFNIKKSNKYLISILITLLIELIVFVLLWFQNLNVHDYYLLDFYLIIPILFLTFFKLLQNIHLSVFNSKIVKSGLFIILILSFCFGIAKTRIKYFGNNTFVSKNFLSEREHRYWEWLKWDYETRIQSAETVTPYLRKIGLKRMDLVLSIPDGSPNVTLYFMDQKGYTLLYNDNKTKKEVIENAIENKVKYLIITNKMLAKDSSISDYTKNRIGEYKNVSVFKL